MSYSFDTVVNRRNTHSLKYDFAQVRMGRDDLLPLWVADMDFPLPEEILSPLRQAVEHGIFGYSDTDEHYFQAVSHWFSSRFGWKPQEEWMVKTPGIVFAIGQGIQAFTHEGEGIVIQEPVYYPFSSTIKANNRRVISNPLIYEHHRYSMDLAHLEQVLSAPDVTMMILCSPHNPVGRVWSREELMAVGTLCLKYGVFLIVDEIHADFTYAGHTHTMFGSLDPRFLSQVMLCTAPSKTFNLAGLQISNIFIPSESHRKAFLLEMDCSGYSQVGLFGIVGCQAAYTYGADWLDALKKYLQENLNYVRHFLRERLPEVTLVEPEGTYLIWLDCSALGFSYKELERRIVDIGHLWLDGGIIFGRASAMFERINIACPRATLIQAMEQLEKALHAPQERSSR